MVEPSQHQSEAGTTLVELLVVMVLLTIVGGVTTVGLVSGFRAQLTATNVAETLDGTRIATQRVRDFVRGATEVCASSTDQSLVLWTDDDGDGSYVDTELDIFELVADASGDDVFQRRTPTATGDVTQLIRDDIINAAVFVYDVPAADQPTDLECTDGVTTTGAGARLRVVDVQFEVENPDPAEPPLETATQVRLRNADLQEGPVNVPPTAAFTVTCPVDNNECLFDASDSSDSDGSINSYDWVFARLDGTQVGVANGSGSTTSFTFPVGDIEYDVTLFVTDDRGKAADVTKTARPVAPGSNPPPTADFTFTCSGRTCDFDGSASSDDVAITAYDWKYGTAGTGTGQTDTFTFPTDGTYAVELTVTDTDGDTHAVSQSVTANTSTILVSQLTGTKASNGKSVTFTVGLSRTTSGSPGAGIVVTVEADPTSGGTVQQSCTTVSNGTCSLTVTGLDKSSSYPLVAKVISVTNTGSFVYDEDQNTDDTETVS